MDDVAVGDVAVNGVAFCNSGMDEFAVGDIAVGAVA